jgi:hypothetical protein
MEINPDTGLTFPEYTTPALPQKFRLYVLALVNVPFYRYGEIGNLLYAIGKNILDGVVLYAMFSMAEQEIKAAAILGVMVKFAYPGITIVSANLTAGFIDRLESMGDLTRQIRKLVRAYTGIGLGQALGGLFLVACYPPIFKALFFGTQFSSEVIRNIIVALYFLHHLCDGSAQIVEGRCWFRVIEIKIRTGQILKLSHNFWALYALSQNLQLILGQVFLWSSLAMTNYFSPELSHPVLVGTLSFGLLSVSMAKFLLPAAYKVRLCS